MDVEKVTKELILALTPEIDCDQMAMGLPPVTSAVFLIAKSSSYPYPTKWGRYNMFFIML
jgi:hypothetical protein